MNDSSPIQRYLTSLSTLGRFNSDTAKNHSSLLKRWESFCRTKRGLDILDAKAEDILAWIEHREHSSVKVKDATIAANLCVLRTFYTWLWEQKIIGGNPAHALPEFVCHPYGASDYLTVDECFRMLETINRRKPPGERNFTMIALLWSTGLRSRELCMLDWEDVDLEDAHIKVRHGKGGKQRIIFLNERIHKDLKRYKRSMLGPKTGPLFNSIETNCPTQQGVGRLKPKRLGEIVNETARAAKISRTIGVHIFRHTFATHMFEAGVPLKDLQQILGHDDPTETTRYIHITIAAAKRLLAEHTSTTLLWRKDQQ